MSAWGTGIFENEAAGAFALEVAEGGGVKAVEQAFDRVLSAGDAYLEAAPAEQALAAADIVVRMRGLPVPATEYAATVDAWIAAARPEVSPDLREKAKRAIARILTEPSQLLETWIEAGQYPAFASAVAAVSESL